jgi:hypothetical protein
MSRRAAFFLALVMATAVLPGCGAPTATVSGEVTVDGQPLDKGVISYVPAEGAGAAATAEVAKGKYHLQTTPGAKWVQVSAPVVVGQRKEYNSPNAPLVDVSGERLPERYNAKTELKFELKPGANVKDWSVEGKQPAPKAK